MTKKTQTLHSQTLYELALKTIDRLVELFPDRTGLKLYGVPRGGISALYLLAAAAHAHRQFNIFFQDNPHEADAIIDDIVDSGATRKRYAELCPGKPFIALIEGAHHWVRFPWETRENGADESATDIGIRLLQHIGEDPERGGLAETPARYIKAWEEWTSGYHVEPKDLLKVFEDGAEGCDQMVSVQNIPVWSHCEHHLAPFFGTATVAYIPDKKIVGLSKLARVVNAYARRLQVQERLTNQIADCINEVLQPVGVGVSIRCRHMCMESRGIRTPNSSTLTTALRGAMLSDSQARAEFLNIGKETI